MTSESRIQSVWTESVIPKSLLLRTQAVWSHPMRLAESERRERQNLVASPDANHAAAVGRIRPRSVRKLVRPPKPVPPRNRVAAGPVPLSSALSRLP